MDFEAEHLGYPSIENELKLGSLHHGQIAGLRAMQYLRGIAAVLTIGVGEISEPAAALLRACEWAMWQALANAVAGRHLTDISHAVESSALASGGYDVVREYTGHFIGSAMHMAPFVANAGRRGKGPRLAPGVCLAIEPMVSLGTPRTHVLPDEWTVKTDDGSWASHWEHSVALTEEGPLVLTAFDGGRAKLAELGVVAAPDPLA